MLYLFVLGIILSPFSHAQDNSCILATKKVKAYKARSEPKVFEDIYPGEALKTIGLSKNGSYVKAQLGRETYWIPKKDTSEAGDMPCAMNACVYLRAGADAQSRPNKKKTTQIVDEGLFNVVSKVKSWYRIKLDTGYIWLTGAQYNKSKVDCNSEEPREEVRAEGRSSPQGWLIGFEGGYIQNVSNEPLQNLVVPRLPAAAEDLINNNNFKNPIIPEVVDGTGWFVGATVEFPLFWWLRNQVALGYKTRTIEIVKKLNPHGAGPVFYEDLVEERVAEAFEFMYLSTTLKSEGWSFLGIVWQPGLQLGIDYSVEDFEFEFRTGANKLNRENVGSGYQKIEFIYGPRLDMNVGFFSLRFSALFNSYGMEPTASVGFQF